MARLVTKLATRALAVIVGLDAVGLAIGCVLRRRRDHAAGTHGQRPLVQYPSR